MLVDPDAVTRWAADSLLTGSVQGTLVVALMWLASRRLAKVPASVQAALWWLAALKLLLTGDRVRLPAMPHRVAVASPAPRVRRVTPREAVASALRPASQSAVQDPSDTDAIRQVGDAASIEQQVIEQRRPMLEELRKELLTEEAVRKSLLEEHPDIQALRAQLEAVQRSLNERIREAGAGATAERQDRELQVVREQLEQLARQQRALIRQQQERLAAAQRQLSAAARAQ